MGRYATDFSPRVLIVDGDNTAAGVAAESIAGYYERRSISSSCDRAAGIERALLLTKYYEYDAAVIALRPAADESASDFLELAREKGWPFPVIVVADNEDLSAAEEVFRLGAADFLATGAGANAAELAETVDNAILRARATREREKLDFDLRGKNTELRAVNELLARQSVRLLKMKKEQEAQRRKMASLLDAIPDGVVFIDSSSRIDLMNPAARTIFRLDGGAEKFGAADLAAFTGFDPFDNAPEGPVPGAIFSREFKITVSEVEEEGAQTGRMLVFHDVTRETELEKMKAEFHSMVSHELRTPLTAIRGAVENFLRGALGDITEQQRTFLTMVLRNVERQTLLINDLLDLAKLEANMMSLNPVQVESEFLLRTAHESFRYAYAEKGVALTLDVGAGLPRIIADERMVSQMLDNLLSNALKFTPKGGTVVLGAETGGEPGEDKVVFRVTDSGIGVPDGLKEKIFDRYFQADSSIQRQHKGTGLGLAICRKMAELHNGTIVCGDGPKGGTVFTITLPVEMAMRKRILVAAADPALVKLDSEVLRREFHIIESGPGENIVEKAAQTLPQLALLDYHSVGGDVSGLFGMLRGNSALARVPVIIVGEGMAEADKVMALKLGAADVISRPYNAGEFLARVKKALGGIL